MSPERVGRYDLFEAVGAGGMATVHLGRLRAESGFSRVVAVKRVHRHFVRNAEFCAMFFDEARLAMRVRHPNVVASFDVVSEGAELLLVMEYVHGESLSALYRAARQAGARIPPRVLVAIMSGVLAGLHAAHEATGEDGAPLELVHRDVSPQNVLVGLDGVPRVLDFGVAKAAGRLQETEDGRVKGKLAYAAPEQLLLATLDRRADLFSVAVILWECLVGRRLFDADSPGAIVNAVLSVRAPRVDDVVTELPSALAAVVARGLEKKPEARFGDAREMAAALEAAVAPATQREVSDWVTSMASASLSARAHRVADVERTPADDVDAPIPTAARPPDARAPMISTLVSDAEAATALEPHGPAPTTRRRALVAAAVLALPLALGAALVVRSRARFEAREHAAPIAAGAPASESPDAASVYTPQGGAAPMDPPRETDPLPSSVGKKPLPGKPAAKPARPTRRSHPDCSDPFTIDERGLRIPRPECF